MIRPANLEDSSVIAQIHVQSWQETYQAILYPHIMAENTLEERLQLWQQILKSKNHIVMVAVADGRIQGFIDVSLNDEKGVAKIMAIYVLKAAQKKGLGKALFEEALKDVHPMQYPEILLSVYDRNPACQFYEYMGARCIGSEDANKEGEDLKVLHYLWERDGFASLNF